MKKNVNLKGAKLAGMSKQDASELSNNCANKREGNADTAAKNEALALVQEIMSNEKKAADFFFREMYPNAFAVAGEYNCKYGVELTAADVCTYTYLACWDNKWAKFRSFKGDSSVHSWVARIAAQATYKVLVEEKYIDGVGNTRANDYRLTVRSIVDANDRQGIVDLVYIPEQHKVLEMYYIEKAKEEAFAKEFGSYDSAMEILKTAQTTLIEQLLNTENPYADIALSPVKPLRLEVEFKPELDYVDSSCDSENKQALRELFRQLYNNEDWDDNVRTFVDGVVANMDWSDRYKEIWVERFYNSTPSRELAERYNVHNTWIDNVYSRMNKQFRIVVRAWWKSHMGE